MQTLTDTWYTPVPSSQAIKLIRKHKGKAFVTIQGSEFMVAIEKADLITSMQMDADNGDYCKWMIRTADWGLQIEADSNWYPFIHSSSKDQIMPNKTTDNIIHILGFIAIIVVWMTA